MSEAGKSFINRETDECVNARPHPGPLPQEREKQVAVPANSSALHASAASVSFAENRIKRQNASVSPDHGERFSLSLGERAGVRASVNVLGVARFGLATLAAVLLLLSLKFPLWQMHLEAPQYREEEALNIAVYPNSFHGDLRELTVLNQYIGVHVPPTLPQFKWLPGALMAGAALGIAASLLRKSIRSRALVFVSAATTAALLFASVQAMTQMRDIGHKRDQKTILAGVKDFTPPFLGTSKIAQFTVRSRLGLGAWLIGGALALQLGAAWVGSTRSSRGNEVLNSKTEMSLLTSAATQ